MPVGNSMRNTNMLMPGMCKYLYSMRCNIMPRQVMVFDDARNMKYLYTRLTEKYVDLQLVLSSIYLLATNYDLSKFISTKTYMIIQRKGSKKERQASELFIKKHDKHNKWNSLDYHMHLIIWIPTTNWLDNWLRKLLDKLMKRVSNTYVSTTTMNVHV